MALQIKRAKIGICGVASKAIGGAMVLLGLGSAAKAETWDVVLPIFEERCVACHSGEFAPLALRLETYEFLISGSENGPVVLPGDAAGSPLIARVEGRAEPRMPLDGPPFLDEAQIALLRGWVDAGAPGPSKPTELPLTTEDPLADGIVTYPEVRRIFGQRCIECHSDNGKYETPPEALRLDTLADILRGGDRIAVIPGNPVASEVMRRVRGLSDPRMPLDGPPWLEETDIALLEAWIEGGARDAEGTPTPIPVGGRVRLRGTLSAPNAVDGAVFATHAGTEIRDAVQQGDRVELRARIAADGTLVAERLRAR
ncbi:c-type cytochrome domain-containing protein [Roseovarius mucosus]|uniref:c-type cytochrome domain-containing protein n=1 Tax=Roseovarius mucosus TaxID=215743 RepID=UPI0035CFAC29